jgi:hypothetical protein
VVCGTFGRTPHFRETESTQGGKGKKQEMPGVVEKEGEIASEALIPSS